MGYVQKLLESTCFTKQEALQAENKTPTWAFAILKNGTIR